MNIYNLSKEFLDIFDELEENGGELTEELEEKLNVTQESFRTSVRNLSSVVKQLDCECDAIKVEQKRLKELYDRKQKVIERIKKILLDAINNFGDVKKTDVKYVAWETGECSIRKSQSVEINESLVKEVELQLKQEATYNKEINQLDVCENIDLSTLVTDYNMGNDIEVSSEELNDLILNVSVDIPLVDLQTGDGYNALKEVVKYSDDYKLSVDASKTLIKQKLKENGSCMPHLAKLVINENVQIK